MTNVHFSNMDNISSAFQSLLKEVTKENSKESILILATRATYLLSKLESFNRLKASNDNSFVLDDGSKIKYYTDNFIYRQLDLDFLQNKKIILLEDLLDSQHYMFYLYTYIKARLNNVDIVPTTITISTHFLMNRKKLIDNIPSEIIYEYSRMIKNTKYSPENTLKESCASDYEKFVNSLQYRMIATISDIGFFRVSEWGQLQKELIISTIDFPLYNSCKNDNFFEQNEKSITLSKEQFKKLCLRTNKWDYIDNFYYLVESPDQRISCDYFRLKRNYYLYDMFGNLFLNFSIRCKYEEFSDCFKVVFSPVILLKSCSYEELWKCFEKLFSDTEFYKLIAMKLRELSNNNDVSLSSIFCNEEDEFKIPNNIYLNVLHAVILNFSLYIMEIFKKEKLEAINLDVEIDKEEFLNSYSKTLMNPIFENLKTSIDSINFQSMYYQKTRDEYGNMEPSDSHIDWFIRQSLLDKNKMGYLTLDYIDKLLKENFAFESNEEKRKYLEKIMLYLLELGCINYDYVTDESKKRILGRVRI